MLQQVPMILTGEKYYFLDLATQQRSSKIFVETLAETLDLALGNKNKGYSVTKNISYIIEILLSVLLLFTPHHTLFSNSIDMTDISKDDLRKEIDG